MTVDNSTFSGNEALYGGGAIAAVANFLAITSSTVSNNTVSYGPDFGGGILQYTEFGTIRMRNTIIAGNRIGTYPVTYPSDLKGTIDSQGHNLIGNSSGGAGYVSTDLLDVDPLLGPLQNNGGPTQTMALLPGSPAIDAGDDTPPLPDFDQRGPGFPRISGPHIDIGAFEVQQGGGGPGPSVRSGANRLRLDAVALTAPSVPVNTSFVVSGGSVLAAAAPLVSTAGMRPFQSPADDRPVPAPTRQRVPGPDAGAVTAAAAPAPDLAVTRGQSDSPLPGSLLARDVLDLFFAGRDEDWRLDGRLA
jgi:predicted outer membrane repeat protein